MKRQILSIFAVGAISLLVIATGCSTLARVETAKTIVGIRQPRARSTASSEHPREPAPDQLSSQQKAEIAMAMGRSLEKRGQLAQAKETYAAFVAANPEHAAALHRLAVVCDKLGYREDALRQYRGALALDPDNPAHHADLGYSLYLNNQWAEAEQSLRRSLELDPQGRRAHNNYGILLARTGRLAEANREFHCAGCTPSQLKMNVAFALTLEQQWHAAQQHYQDVLRVDPSSSDALAGIQQVNYLSGKFPNDAHVQHSANDNGECMPTAPPVFQPSQAERATHGPVCTASLVQQPERAELVRVPSCASPAGNGECQVMQ